jgi:hypothetical protein
MPTLGGGGKLGDFFQKHQILPGKLKQCNSVSAVPELAEILAGVLRGVGGGDEEPLLRGVLQRSRL